MWETLPLEILKEIISLVDTKYLYLLSLCSTTFNVLSNKENLWINSYSRDLPCTYKALLIAPNPHLWKFSFPGSRRFLYLARLEIEKQGFDKICGFDEVEIVISVMEGNLKSLIVQKAASYIIRRLAFDTDNGIQVKKNRERFGKRNTMKHLLTTMKMYNDDPELLSGILCAMGNLAVSASNCIQLVQFSGVEFIVKIMKKYNTNTTVIDNACFVLCNVAEEAQHKEIIKNEGALDLAIEHIKQRDTPKYILKPYLDLFGTLAQDNPDHSLLGHEILQRLHEIITDFVEEEDLLPQVLGILIVFCEITCLSYAHTPTASENSNKQWFIDNNMVSLLLEIIKRHSKSTEIISKAFLLLFILLWKNDQPGMDKNRLQFVDEIIESLKYHKDDIVLQRTAAAVLADFSHEDSELKQYIYKQGGYELICRAASLKTTTIGDDGWDLLAEFLTLEQ